jgi:UDP-2-acetamido-2,6-beta-L-arabino-hexul-4-ose reductase
MRKIERFVVLSGQAQINVRRLYDPHVVSFDVDGRQPCIVDMPTMWAHNIINTGPDELMTLFWTNELFDEEHPDTVPHPVAGRTPVGVSS